MNRCESGLQTEDTEEDPADHCADYGHRQAPDQKLAEQNRLVLVVTGAGAEEVQKALANLPVCFIHNPDWESGQSTSVKAGVAALSNDVAAAMVFLGDQPQIPLHVVEEIIETYRSSITAEPIFIPTVDGKRANPVLLDRSIFAQLVHLAGDTGARALFAQFPICYIPFSEPDLLLDIDNPDDYQRLIEKQPPF